MSDEVLIIGNGERAARLAAALRQAGYAVAAAADGAAARGALAEPGITVLVADLAAAPDVDRAGLLSALSPDGGVPPATLEEMERRQIIAALRHTNGNRREAARLLGIARSTLHVKLHRYVID